MTEPARDLDPTVVLRCHAPHPDARRDGDACGTLLGYFPALGYEFVTTSRKGPLGATVHVWGQCPRKTCRMWNKFRIVDRRASPRLLVAPGAAES